MRLPEQLAIVLTSCVLGVVGCSSDTNGGNPFVGHDSINYQASLNWLCHPDLDPADNICRRNLDATVIQTDGATSLERFGAATSPAYDCFYVYPTISMDGEGNSDFDPGDEELFITLTQAARYTEVCRMFAPVYRQTTIMALLFGDDEADRELAYADVLDAFKTYMAHHNEGRGYLLLGHSQGSIHLIRLLQEEIEDTPYLADRLIAAHLIGMTVEVPKGQDVGGSFARTPLCRSPDQHGCVVTYASFRDTEPPDASSLFGFTDDPDTQAGCTNPASLAGGPTQMDGYAPTEIPQNLAPFISNPGAWADPTAHPPISTTFVKAPGLVTAECVERNGFHYLEVTVTADASDPRADDVGGDFQEGWGLHLADYNLALGDLVRLAASQAAAWQSSQ